MFQTTKALLACVSCQISSCDFTRVVLASTRFVRVLQVITRCLRKYAEYRSTEAFEVVCNELVVFVFNSNAIWLFLSSKTRPASKSLCRLTVCGQSELYENPANCSHKFLKGSLPMQGTNYLAEYMHNTFTRICMNSCPSTCLLT